MSEHNRGSYDDALYNFTLREWWPLYDDRYTRYYNESSFYCTKSNVTTTRLQGPAYQLYGTSVATAMKIMNLGYSHVSK